MKNFLAFAIVACMWIAFGHTAADNYAYAREIVKMMAMSPEWDDCLENEQSTNEVEVLYPTMESVFATAMPSNSCAYGWTQLERRKAFDDFLFDFSTNSAADLSQEYVHTGGMALMCSWEKKYTNSLVAAKTIVQSQSLSHLDLAMRMLLDMQSPNIELNSAVLITVTNHLRTATQFRNSVMASYVRNLMDDAVEYSVVTNAADSFFTSRENIENRIALDQLMLFSYASYSNSIRRLGYAREALAMPFVSDKELLYFSNVTNLLVDSSMEQ